MQFSERNKIIVFFSNNVSLELWKKKKILDREIELYKFLSKQKFFITFVTYGSIKDFKIAKNLDFKVEVIPLFSKIQKNFFTKLLIYFLSPFLLRKTIKDASILTCHQLTGGLMALINAKVFGKKLIIRAGWEPTYKHYLWEISYLKYLFHKLNSYLCYFFAEKIIVSSKLIKKFILSKYIISAEVNVIPNAIDIDKFKILRLKKKYDLINVSRLTDQKNLFDVLKVVKKTNLQATLVGDGSLKHNLKSYAKKNNLKVNFIKEIDNSKLPKLLNQHKVYISTSKIEGSPKAIFEAQSCGLPIYALWEENIAELIKIDNGYISNNLCKLSKKIESDIKNKSYLKLGKSSSKKIKNENSFKNLSKKYLSIYNKLI